MEDHVYIYGIYNVQQSHQGCESENKWKDTVDTQAMGVSEKFIHGGVYDETCE